MNFAKIFNDLLKRRVNMANKVFDIKWQKDLLTHVSAFTAFVFEGNVHDLHPFLQSEEYEYLSLEDVLANLIRDKYCVVFFDHTKKPGDPKKVGEMAVPEGSNEYDDSAFNSFVFLEKSVVTADGKTIPNPNIELFKKYYAKEYMDRIKATADQSLQGGITLDMTRIHDAMKDFGENVDVEQEETEVNGVKVIRDVYKPKCEDYNNTKPFFFILPNVSRFMTTPGKPDDREHALLSVLYKATQLKDTPCKLAMFVDKMNDFPTWFEAEGCNPSLKKVLIPNPNGTFRETYYELELAPIMKKIEDPKLLAKALLKFSAYTDKYSLRKLEQLRQFINSSVSDEDHDLTKIDKTVFKFEFGQDNDPWRTAEMFDTIESLEDELNGSILGQGHVSRQIVQALRAAITGVNSSRKNDRRPKAVFFLAGPTGTGKTEMCRKLAEKVFGKEDSMIRFDMSEFRDIHNDSRLFGAPPGYVGYEAGGELTKAIKENPFCVLLFDEIEKASPKIWDKFLQILGDGRVTDGKGETVYFSQCIIVFTSNLGITALVDNNNPTAMQERENLLKEEAELVEAYLKADDAQKPALLEQLKTMQVNKAAFDGLIADRADDPYFKFKAKANGTDPWDEFCAFVSEVVKTRIEAYFEKLGRREVLGRIGNNNIIVYNFIDREISAPLIADLTIKNFVSYLRDDNDIPLDLDVSDQAARDFIYKNITDLSVINLGGRGIRMTVEKLLSEPVSTFIFAKANQFFKSGGSGVLPRLKGKLVLEDGYLTIVDA